MSVFWACSSIRNSRNLAQEVHLKTVTCWWHNQPWRNRNTHTHTLTKKNTHLVNTQWIGGNVLLCPFQVLKGCEAQNGRRCTWQPGQQKCSQGCWWPVSWFHDWKLADRQLQAVRIFDTNHVHSFSSLWNSVVCGVNSVYLNLIESTATWCSQSVKLLEHLHEQHLKPTSNC